MKEPKSMRQLVAEVSAKLGLSEARSASALFEAWEQTVGADVARRCRPEILKDKVLRLVVTNPAWATELKYLVPALIKRINEAAGTKAVEKVEVKIRPGQKPAPQTRQTNVRLPRHEGPTASELAKAEALAAETGDPKLGEALKKAHLAGKMRRKRG